MNYLAHLYLADDSPESMVGSLMGDFVKGELQDRFAHPTQEGIREHRSIDAFTDRHPVVMRSKRRMRPPYRRYAGILVDVFFDHILAQQWPKFARVPLDEFTGTVYCHLTDHLPKLPVNMQPLVRYMTTEDLLGSYQHPQGIQRALLGIEQRLKRPSQLSAAISELEREQAELVDDFLEFFPDLIHFVDARHTSDATQFWHRPRIR